MKILTINPGSTSTKVAVYEDEEEKFVENIVHTPEELAPFREATDQFAYRKNVVVKELEARNIPFDFDAVIGRGGLAKPLASGVYEVNQQMLDDIRQVVHKHACDLGCLIAYDIAQGIPGCRSFIADPGVVDELCDEARISGSPLLPQYAIWHALNQRAIARRFAHEQHTRNEDLDLIICHLGGGISVAAHQRGRAVDANNAFDGSGPFSPERAGTLPAGDLIRLCFSGKFTEEDLLKRVAGRAGLTAHLGTNDMIEIRKRIQAGDQHAKKVVDAMIYHVAKSIVAEAAVLCGHVDAILLTGGLAYDGKLIADLRRRIDFIAPVHVYPGQNEMKALAMNALDVLRGKVQAKVY